MTRDERFSRATDLAHALVRERVRVGETVVDATVGTGADTVFLSGCVGESGRVIGFDVQDEALERTRRKLQEAGLENGVVLHGAGHERMGEFVAGELGAVMFNLGYLPGGDKSLVTTAETTLAALQAALQRLRPGGLITVVCYPGHSAGAGEAEAVVAWAAGLEQQRFGVLRGEYINQRNAPPFLIAIERRG